MDKTAEYSSHTKAMDNKKQISQNRQNSEKSVINNTTTESKLVIYLRHERNLYKSGRDFYYSQAQVFLGNRLVCCTYFLIPATISQLVVESYSGN